MKHTPEFRVNRLAWRFRQSGGNGVHARQFADLDEPAREAIVRFAEVAESELPALAYYLDARTWALVTSERLVWEIDGRRNDVRLEAIVDATVDEAALRLAKATLKLADLTIVTKDGERHMLHLEAGPPFVGFWNALKMVAMWNKSP